MFQKLMAALFMTVSLAGAAQAQSKQDFVLVNKTGYVLSEIYVSPARADNWGDDLLENDDEGMDDDETRTISFTRAGSNCIWDLKVVYEEDDSSAVWHDINLCEVSKITIRWNKSSGDTTAKFD